MTDIAFDDVEEFGATRAVEPNPYEAVVKALTPDSGKGKAFVVDGNAAKDAKGQYTNVNIRKARRLLTDAGDAHGVTVRAKFAELEGGAKTRVTFTTIKKIVRKPKEESAATPAATPTPAKKVAAPKTGK
jgi:hypothetical protein